MVWRVVVGAWLLSRRSRGLSWFRVDVVLVFARRWFLRLRWAVTVVLSVGLIFLVLRYWVLMSVRAGGLSMRVVVTCTVLCALIRLGCRLVGWCCDVDMLGLTVWLCYGLSTGPLFF